MVDLTISIVLYKSEISVVKPAIESVCKTDLNFKLYLIDNSPTDFLKVLSDLSEHIEYIKTDRNLGFGKAHNIAMQKALNDSKYHLVLNPDVYFDQNVLENILRYMDANSEVGQVMPKICYPNGEIQRLCKLLPTPADLILRRFLYWLPATDERNEIYELQNTGYDKIMNIPYLSGCFMFFRTSALKEIGLFDERIFMYIEDADITRRIHARYQTIFLPQEIAFHHYAKGSYKNWKLMMYNIHGAIVYFNKWGWFFDPERKKINRKVLENYCK